MDRRVYILAVAAFVVGTVELIIGGTLDLIAADLNVSVSSAGQLITMFSVAFAISAPILFAITTRIERKKLLLITLALFSMGNVLAYLSPDYNVLMLSRIVSAASGSLLVVLCVTIASQIVQTAYRARAIGVIYMGISGSLVLGVPLGLVLSNAYSWRAPFLFIAILTLVVMVCMYFLLAKFPIKPTSIPLWQQLVTLKNRKIFTAQLTSVLFLTGHLTLYAYLTPFFTTTLHLDASWVTIFYFIYGIAAVCGGGLGGWLVDKWGSKKSIMVIITAYLIAMAILPLVTGSIYTFLVVMIIWGGLSWSITPAIQNYLIESSPGSGEIQQTLNNSALHIGIAAGSSIGGIVISQYTVETNAWVGAGIIVITLLIAFYSITRPLKQATGHANMQNHSNVGTEA
ncbi:MFS transporter [Paenibacillus sp. N1-5-1-14]|uniref:MFS transporter n=1 Tax=Paenibacillus radicibacter TaxID=2972488 RepID=UPI0021595348|nr:MFS transporter [Paenibacillus radicibacter]MCR8642799.1 MFS transporter [Paenibacillus radicibacter]